MGEIAPPELTIREPAPEEAGRMAHFFRNGTLPPGAQILAAVRHQPIERFVAAVAAWQEGNIVRFRLACQPGVPRADIAAPLILRVEEGARAAGFKVLHYAESLADDHEWRVVLGENGFESRHSERFFEAPGLAAWTRVMQIYEKHRQHIPFDWRTEPIRLHQPELALEVIGEHRLMPLGELRDGWRADSSAAFELDLSSFLFAGPRPIGVLLLRRNQDALCVDVRVVRVEHPRLRALGNACLLHHVASQSDPNGPIRWLRFRAGQREHRETANLAFRMNGRELPPRHVFGKKL
jgi:hypothetical protein